MQAVLLPAEVQQKHTSKKVWNTLKTNSKYNQLHRQVKELTIPQSVMFCIYFLDTLCAILCTHCRLQPCYVAVTELPVHIHCLTIVLNGGERAGVPTTWTMSVLFSVVPVNHDCLTESQHAQSQDLETEAAQWTPDIIHLIIYTLFSSCGTSCPVCVRELIMTKCLDI